MAQSRIVATLRQPSVGLIGLVSLLLVLLISLSVHQLREEYEDRLSTARQDVSRLSRVLVEHTARTVQAADLVLVRAADAFRNMPQAWRADRGTVADVLSAHLVNSPQIRAIAMFDAAGRNIGDTRGLPPPVVRPDREYITALRDNPGVDVHVGRPEIGAATGQWRIAISRARRAPDGAFDGVAVAFVEPSYFADIYKLVVETSGTSITLVTDEGYLVARAPEIESLMGSRLPFPYLGRDELARAPSGLYRAKSDVDGIDRIASFRKAAGLPLVVTVGANVQEALASWYGNVVERVVGIALVSLAVGLLAVILFRQIRRGERSELSTRQSEQFLREALDAVATSISIKDASSRFVLLNRVARERFGLGQVRVEGLVAADIFPPSVAQWGEDRDKQVFETGTATLFEELTSVYPDGVTRTVLRSKAPIFTGPYRNAVTHVVTTSIDITERKILEEQIVQAKHAADLANRTKSEFLANMSHELRTPLNAVIGFSELILGRLHGPMNSPRYEEYLSDIYASAKHLLGIINDILDLSRIEAGQMVLDETLIDVAGLVRSSLQFIAGRAGTAGLAVSADVAPGLPALLADQRKMKQVLINLLANAVKFTPHGGKIAISAKLGGDGGLAITVADTGVGISAQDLPGIFTPFQQASSALSRSHEGTGLGLSITKSLVELHGGRLVIESVLGSGTTVTAILPPQRMVAMSAMAQP